jgi:pyruvate dehydrogenase E1 component alpha subunit
MISRENLSEMLLKMYKIRLLEEEIEKLYRQGLVRGGIHFYIGEEAVAVGACSAIETTDYVISTHRGHGHCVAKGGNLNEMMAELLGRETGYCKGRGGSMHLAAVNIGLLSCSGIVGGGIPMSAGAAFSSQYRGTKQVTLSFFGDGASNQGSFHETLNLAAVWKLPVVFICENNLFGITVPVSKSTSVKDIADRAAAYGIPGHIADGMDVLNVHEAVRKAVDRARNGYGPSLVECKTYRFKGHWVDDPVVYRTEKEVAEWRKKDPILTFRKKLLAEDEFSEADLDNLKKQAEKEIAAAVDFAQNSPFPAAGDVTQYVYCPA